MSGEVVVKFPADPVDGDLEALRTEIVELADRAPVVRIDMPSSTEVSAAALDVLAEAGRVLVAANRTLLLTRVDPLLVRRISDAGHTGSFAVASPPDGELRSAG
jgi:hypothetical protein